jgi:hypothetical protein
MGARAAAMAERLALTARRAGITEAGVTRIVDAFSVAMLPRDQHLGAEHHPDYLHPGRTAVILMEDLGFADPLLIAAGTLLESLYPELSAAGTDAEAQALVETIPTPTRDGELLLELLLAADPSIRRIALAERLDHVRRLHLREPEGWHSLLRETTTIYLALARMTDHTLARRFEWWCRVFQERFLEPADRGG